MQMNVQLHHVISDITGATGLRIIDAILAGERDPHRLARHRDPRCKKDEQTIAMALEGHWRDDHLFALKQAVELYRFYHRQLSEVDERVEDYLATFEDRSDGKTLRKSPKPKAGSNTPDFDIRNHLYKMTGVDLTMIDGISGYPPRLLVHLGHAPSSMHRHFVKKDFQPSVRILALTSISGVWHASLGTALAQTEDDSELESNIASCYVWCLPRKS